MDFFKIVCWSKICGHLNAKKISDGGASRLDGIKTRVKKMKKCRYVSIAGGGTKGVVYAGALQALERRMTDYTEWHTNLLGVSGTSAGSIVALFLLLNTSQEVRTKYVKLLSNIDELLTHPDVSLLLSNFGWENGNTFREIIQDILKDSGLSPECTLGDLKKLLRKEFVCIATDLNASRPITFSSTDTPHVRVCDAIYMSSSVPFVFQPMKYEGRLVVDGCMSCNLPQEFPDSDTMYWYISNSVDQSIETWPDYLQGIAFCSMNLQPLPTSGALIGFKLCQHLSTKPSFDLEINESVIDALYNWGYSFMTDVFVEFGMSECIEHLLLTVVQTFVQDATKCLESDEVISPAFAVDQCTE
jgi:hypothetical protein